MCVFLNITMLDLSCFKSGFRKCRPIVGLGFQQELQIKTSESADFHLFSNLLTSEMKKNVKNFKLTYKNSIFTPD